MEKLSNYVYNINSIAFLPSFNDVGELETLVLEQQEVYNVSKNPYELMEKSVQHYGSTMRAVKDGFKQFVGGMNLAPVAFNPNGLIVWFPTKGLNDHLSAWVNIITVADCKALKDNSSLIMFINGATMEVNVPLKKMMKCLMQAYAVFAILYIRSIQSQITKQRKQKIHFRLREDGRGYEID